MKVPEDNRREVEEKRQRMQEAEERLAAYRNKTSEEISQERLADLEQRSRATGADYLRQQSYSDAEIEKYRMVEKEKTARNFYHSCEDRHGKPYDDAKANDHMRGIDFRGEVSVETKKKGDIVWQQQTKGADGSQSQGNYYADGGTKKDELGIAGERVPRPGDHDERKAEAYTVQRDTTVLKSTARDVELNPNAKKPDGELRYGGGTQYATRPQDREAMQKVFPEKEQQQQTQKRHGSQAEDAAKQNQAQTGQQATQSRSLTEQQNADYQKKMAESRTQREEVSAKQERSKSAGLNLNSRTRDEVDNPQPMNATNLSDEDLAARRAELEKEMYWARHEGAKKTQRKDLEIKWNEVRKEQVQRANPDAKWTDKEDRRDEWEFRRSDKTNARGEKYQQTDAVGKVHSPDTTINWRSDTLYGEQREEAVRQSISRGSGDDADHLAAAEWGADPEGVNKGEAQRGRKGAIQPDDRLNYDLQNRQINQGRNYEGQPSISDNNPKVNQGGHYRDVESGITEKARERAVQGNAEPLDVTVSAKSIDCKGSYGRKFSVSDKNGKVPIPTRHGEVDISNVHHLNPSSPDTRRAEAVKQQSSQTAISNEQNSIGKGAAAAKTRTQQQKSEYHEKIAAQRVRKKEVAAEGKTKSSTPEPLQRDKPKTR